MNYANLLNLKNCIHPMWVGHFSRSVPWGPPIKTSLYITSYTNMVLKVCCFTSRSLRHQNKSSNLKKRGFGEKKKVKKPCLKEKGEIILKC